MMDSEVNFQASDIGGIPIRWTEAGTGTPVVLLHGTPTGPLLWRHVLPHLDGVRAMAWEMVGYAGSIRAGIGRDISVAQQAEYLESWMRELGLERAILVGHDLGGGVAQSLAVKQPGMVGGLILANAITHDSWADPLRQGPQSNR